MNILLSAYSFRPHSGSESGVGWDFAVELAKCNTVYVITRARNKTDIEKELYLLDLQNKIIVYYYDIPKLSQWYKPATVSDHTYYFFWQLALPFVVNKIFKNHTIDLIHHITLGSFRVPSFLVFYNKPFIFGPVGGGENFPYMIKKSFPIKFIFFEVIRDAINRISIFNPFLLYTYSRSLLIVCRTKETLKLIPKWYHHKCMIEIGIGAKIFKGKKIAPKHDGQHLPLKILYAGRPLYWKGLHLVIQAYAKALHHCPDIQFTVIGPGNNDWAKKIATENKVEDKISWLGKVDTNTLDNLYENSDILMFPSLREAGGAVAVEAMVYSLPVLCLDLGGPSQIVNDNWGILIQTKNKTQAQLIDSIADKIMGLYFDRKPLHTMKVNANKELVYYSMEKIVGRIYSHNILNSAVRKIVNI